MNVDEGSAFSLKTWAVDESDMESHSSFEDDEVVGSLEHRSFLSSLRPADEKNTEETKPRNVASLAAVCFCLLTVNIEYSIIMPSLLLYMKQLGKPLSFVYAFSYWS